MVRLETTGEEGHTEKKWGTPPKGSGGHPQGKWGTPPKGSGGHPQGKWRTPPGEVEDIFRVRGGDIQKGSGGIPGKWGNSPDKGGHPQARGTFPGRGGTPRQGWTSQGRGGGGSNGPFRNSSRTGIRCWYSMTLSSHGAVVLSRHRHCHFHRMLPWWKSKFWTLLIFLRS